MQPELKPIPTNDRILGSSGPSYAPGSALPAASAQKVMRNTQLLLALTMVPTALGAYFGMATGGIIQQYPIISFFVMLAATIGLQFAIVANRNSSLGVVFLLLLTGLLGWFIGPLLNYALALKNGAQLVGYAAGGTALVFFGMATVASVTKRDFSFMGKFLFVGMIALLLAMVANMFLQIPALALTISTLVIVVFSLFLLHDLSRIVTGGETNYIMAATGVYMSLFNIFVNLLQILMALSGERD
jgi:FtsH-binding integral membrane protein